MSSPLIVISSGFINGRLRLRSDYVYALRSNGADTAVLPEGENIERSVDRADGLLLPGGDDPLTRFYGEQQVHEIIAEPASRTEFEIKLIKAFVEAEKPVLGICYGMQVLNIAFGGTLYQDIEAQADSTCNHRTEGHEVLIEQNPYLPEGRYKVNSAHHQAVKKPGNNIVEFIRSADGLTEGIYVSGACFALGVQWHPERSINDRLSDIIIKKFVGEASKG